MAHRIENHDKQQGLVQAWHGLTEVVPEITLENNWLTKWDIAPVILDKRGQPSRYAVLEATDIPELEVGKAYNAETFSPLTNKNFLDLVRQSIGGTEHSIVSVGSVRNRGRVFLSIKLNGMESFEAAGRKFSAYLNFGNGHDKSSVLWVNTSNICTVCDNTFTFNLFSVENKDQSKPENADDIRTRIRHTKNIVLKLPDLAQLIDKAIGVQGKFAAMAQTLGAMTLTVPTAHNLFAGFVGRKAIVDKGLSTRAVNTVNRLTSLFESGKGNAGNTRFDAFSASTDYYTHESSGNSDNPFKQFLSSEYGAGQDAKSDFWDILIPDDEDADFENCVKRGEALLSHTTA